MLAGLLKPKNTERLKLLRERRSLLPDHAQKPSQALGSYSLGCGATHGIYEACNFGCTACYLGKNANRQPAMPFEEVYQQLVMLRKHLGPTGNVQITSGEVTLLPVEDLLRIVKAAINLELSPMVMTHGDVFLHHPGYLAKLVQEGGLRKLSIHVDTTQRGRKGIVVPRSEDDLNQVRDAMAAMLRETAVATGKRLKAATTLTVNGQNLPQLPGIVSWFLNNLDAFRMLSLQPQAKTGRTQKGRGPDAASVWSVLEEALGRELNPWPMTMGHQACNRMAFLVAIEAGNHRQIVELVRKGNRRDQDIMTSFLHHFEGVLFNDRPTLSSLSAVLGVLIRKPRLIRQLLSYAAIRLWHERKRAGFVTKAFLSGRLRIRPFAMVVHAFMSTDELDSPLGKERLAACAFKVPLGDRMVSMCEMNGSGLRESTYTQADAAVPV